MTLIGGGIFAFLRYGGRDRSVLFGLDVYTQINTQTSGVVVLWPQ